MIGFGVILAIAGFICHLHGEWVTNDPQNKLDRWESQLTGKTGYDDSGEGYQVIGVILLIVGLVLVAAAVLYRYRRGIGLTITGGVMLPLAFICSEVADKTWAKFFLTEDVESYGKKLVLYRDASNIFTITSLAFLGIGIIASIAFYFYNNHYHSPGLRVRARVPAVYGNDAYDLTVRCRRCGAIVLNGNKFCSKCGESVVRIKTCPHCGQTQPYESKYCSQCGQSIEQKWLEVKCPHCGASVGIGNKYCTHCGTPMESIPEKRTTCPRCGSPVQEGNKFCQQCGAAVQANTTAAPTSHSWRCCHCGSMVSEEICPFCGQSSQG